MAWKLDNIDFETYGVAIGRSSGVLDLPELLDNSIDWLDENGKDFILPVEETKYQDGEIVLSCWITAENYTQFKNKVNVFLEAISAPGKRLLQTPFSNSIEVYLLNEVVIVRETSYVSTMQVGVFTLKLIVTGDPQYKLMTIYRGDGQIQGVAKYRSDAKFDASLQNVHTISFKAEFDTKPTLGRGDYIIFDSQEYFHFEYPEIDKNSTNKYVYNLKYEHKFKFLDDPRFKILGKAQTNWYGSMSEALNLIIQNTQRTSPGMFIAGTVELTESRNHRFDSESCLQVLNRLVSEYEMEYEYVMNPNDGVISINISKRIGNASEITLKYGKGNNAYNIRRIPTPRERLCTRLYAWGSDKNLPVGYPYERLALDAPIERNFFNMQIERDKVYDDIKPERTGVVTGYSEIKPPATFTYAPGTEHSSKPIKIYDFHADETSYEIIDITMPFDLKEKDSNGNTVYWLPDRKPKIHLNTGDLAGYEFEVQDYNHDTKTFKINPFTESSIKLPSDTLKPRPAHGSVGDSDYYPGDQYVILDINLPQSYIDDAKSRLYDAAYSSMYDGIDFNPPQADYEVDILPGYDFTARPGDTLLLDDPDFTLAPTSLRIVSYSKNLYTGWKKVSLSPNVYKSVRNRLESKVAELERAIQAAKLNQVNQSRGNQQTTSEVANKLIDPTDGKLKAVDLIRPRDITPFMMAPELAAPQLSIKDSFVDLNVDENPNKITIDAGKFLHHNFYSVDSNVINQIKEI